MTVRKIKIMSRLGLVWFMHSMHVIFVHFKHSFKYLLKDRDDPCSEELEDDADEDDSATFPSANADCSPSQMAASSDGTSTFFLHRFLHFFLIKMIVPLIILDFFIGLRKEQLREWIQCIQWVHCLTGGRKRKREAETDDQ